MLSYNGCFAYILIKHSIAQRRYIYIDIYLSLYIDIDIDLYIHYRISAVCSSWKDFLEALEFLKLGLRVGFRQVFKLGKTFSNEKNKVIIKW